MSEIILQGIVAIAEQAGEAIMTFYRQGETQTWTKKDDSPITEADLAAHKVIVAGLAELTPEIPVLSEESDSITWQQRQQWQRYWLVDPLDGTKEFIKQNGEFTVNIALIENNQPTMAVVYAPALNKTYYANSELGCFFKGESGDVEKLTLNERELNSPLKVVGSRSHPSPELAEFIAQFEQTETVPTGSSLKFCLVAQGLADVYPRFGPTMEWDTGAGQCIAQCAGAEVSKFDRQPLDYNTKDSLLNEYFIVFNPKLIWR
ncbi:3'(2'),5'-bisphosphate nucleotidase CysQ [Psychrobium sp. 1_MG-2023]|uniref:3'(2'),5'-bisphosphate nucleotidase CysQ n=1 Tax=Psychrobium sp. 1_MG-2023 TaxID=3062624 RepID=UPI000C326BE3|nr:3'(2'),5'-bisphosphate nucleotidase CysQ [Psychrobium sp. 1_MG-2023]MDP2560089.1 3'(2'),5'-bisphosphate nucleotidase CysQ [Psychrobium sp. 1_MG-2023]PKF56252.1 3'(2'),5'-bisphosphate nucleotidase [Alteromonadales bacterium alter-6D02]